YFYASGKLILPLAAVVALYCLLRWRMEFFRRYAAGFVLLGLALAIVFMPYAIFSSHDNWYAFTVRAREMSIFTLPNQNITFARLGVHYDQSRISESIVQNL